MGGERDTSTAASKALPPDPPPAYDVANNPGASSSEAANDAKLNGKTQDHTRKGMSPTLRAKHSNTTIFDEYANTPGWGRLRFRMTPDPSSPDFANALWAATLTVWCDDVARLMREGFFWSEDNVVPEEGWVFWVKDPEWLKMGFRNGRVWILADTSNGENPRWVGHFEVVARGELEIISRFRLQDLSCGHISCAFANNARDQLVYGYYRPFPRWNFNTIYDDKQPLKGWWPWPKKGGKPAPDPYEGMNTWDGDLPSWASASAPAPPAFSNPAPSVSRHQEPSSCVIM